MSGAVRERTSTLSTKSQQWCVFSYTCAQVQLRGTMVLINPSFIVLSSYLKLVNLDPSQRLGVSY